MRISHRHRFVFFAWPKTGSRSVRRMLDPYSDVRGRPAHELTPDFPFYNHMRPVELLELFRERGWEYSDYLTFVTVRNPWSRLVSLFEMHAFREGGFLSRFRTRNARHRGFGRWIREVAAEPTPGPGEEVQQSVIALGVLPYLSFAGDARGRLLVDRVLKLEEMDRALPPLLGELGIPVSGELPRVGRGRYRGHYRDYYDQECRTLVGNRYGEEIERFGYRF